MAKNTKKNQYLKLPLTNYDQLIREFPIIVDIQDGDGEIPSTHAVIRKTIIFDDGTKLLSREHIKDNKIAWFYYDYIDSNKMTLIKIHSESHDDGKKKSKKFQTQTEPFHIHPSEKQQLSSLSRFPNFEHQNLRSLVESIYIHRLILKAKGLE